MPLDADGLERQVDDPATIDTGLGGGAISDLGAHEFGAALPTQQWSDLGHALAGTHGDPVLSGSGTLCVGTTLELRLDNAAENQSAWLILGLSQLGLPLKGGTLVPSPDLVVPGLPTGPDGTPVIPLTFDTDGASGLSLIWRFWVPDATGPAGFAASNGLCGLIP